MNRVRCLLCILCFHLFTIAGAQTFYSNCVIPSISTNPANAFNSEKPYLINRFNWNATSFQLNWTNYTSISSPFYDPDSYNVLRFGVPTAADKDFYWTDGWEIIRYGFGYMYDANGNYIADPNNKDKNPYLVLYNRYTGLLRTFLATGVNGFNSSQVVLRHKQLGGFNFKTSILSQAQKNINALDQYQDVSFQSASVYENEGRKWAFADFPMTYDPCTCHYEGALMQLDYNLISTANVTLKGLTTGTVKPVDITNASSKSNPGYSFDYVTGAVKAGKKSYDDITSFIDDFLKGKNQTELNSQATKISLFQQLLSKSDLLKQGLKAAPYVGTAVSFLDFFSGGGKQSAGPQEVKMQPMAINTTSTFTGQINNSQNYKSFSFFTPGSHNQAGNEDFYPLYNKPMGIFNLMETPKIKFEQDIVFPNTRTYQLAAPIKYVYNTSAGLLAPEVYGSIVMEFDTTAVVQMETATNQLMRLSSYSYATRFVPIGALGDLYVQMANPPYPINVYVKIMASFTREDATANTQNILYVSTYRTAPGSGPIVIGPSFQDDLAINQGVNLFSNVGGWNSVSIINPSKLPNSNIDISSSNGSKRITGGTGVTIKAGVTLKASVTIATGMPNGNTTETSPETQASIDAFCNSSIYKLPARTNYAVRKHSDEQNSVNVPGEGNEEGNHALFAYPNPSNGHVTFRYYTEELTHVQLNIVDLTSRVLATPVNSNQEAGLYEVAYDATSLPAGVYIYTLQTNKGKEIKRLVIVR